MKLKSYTSCLVAFGLAALSLIPSTLDAGAAPEQTTKLLQDIHRIVFLGDSITQGGQYVVDVECWLLAQGIDAEVLNLGLGSETATDLTPAENAGHAKKYGFGRPFISERLDRVLKAAKPDLLFVCYGMNDGGALPTDESGTKRYAEAITTLRDKALAAGVKRAVFCTSPVHDNKGDPKADAHDQNMARYTAWLLSKRAEGWDVVDIHTPMRSELDARRAKDPAFALAKDGVHPGREGHWLMAQEILRQSFGAKLDGVSAAEALFPAHGAEIRTLVQERMTVRFNAWMTKIGHQRPGVPGGPRVKPGPSLDEANRKATELTKQINQLR